MFFSHFTKGNDFSDFLHFPVFMELTVCFRFIVGLADHGLAQGEANSFLQELIPIEMEVKQNLADLFSL